VRVRNALLISGVIIAALALGVAAELGVGGPPEVPQRGHTVTIHVSYAPGKRGDLVWITIIMPGYRVRFHPPRDADGDYVKTRDYDGRSPVSVQVEGLDGVTERGCNITTDEDPAGRPLHTYGAGTLLCKIP